MNQLEKITELIGKPSKEDLASIQSKYVRQMMDKIKPKVKRYLLRFFFFLI